MEMDICRLKEIRSALGLTQKSVYDGICSRKHYSRIENNRGKMSIFLLIKFSQRLRIPMEQMVQIKDVD
ncbi:MAG: helix-turn-helix transcriptional regulator [Aerococcaceae bacterium]|nr:helix-turn-helix transcriptional regulator [Aerococcaceae bacterium]